MAFPGHVTANFKADLFFDMVATGVDVFYLCSTNNNIIVQLARTNVLVQWEVSMALSEVPRQSTAQ